jgi:Xaa-Pro aminopeptidase
MKDTIPGGVTAFLKAHKNDVEIEGFRKAMLNDGIAWVKFLRYLEDSLESSADELYEYSIAQKLIEFRKENNDYLGESFSPIVAYGRNAALPHYQYSSRKKVKVERKSFLMVDSGAHYPYGTTDTTRTIVCGRITKEQRGDFTRVLKGMINLSRALFILGTRGASLDILARGEVMRGGKVYMHGTGHGIGHNLCVHEGPQSIRMEENPVAIAPGMILSNEPAVYKEGEYGIRTENTLLCKEMFCNNKECFYGFETISFVPLDLRAVDVGMLSRDEIKWINGYHREVYKKLSPFLDESLKRWLSEKTSDIGD